MAGKTGLMLSSKVRFLFEALMGTVFYSILMLTFYVGDPFNWRGYFFSVWLFVFISEGIFLFNKFIACRHPWHTHLQKRIVWISIFSIIWFQIAIWISHIVKPFLDYEMDKPMTSMEYNTTIVLAMLMVTIYVVLLFAYNYHHSLRLVLLENERLKQDKLRQDYQALQDQLNPHFLFNNLSTLIAIIRCDKDAAIDFATNFSDVYRYVLESSKNRSISLRDELKFMESYGKLHKSRLRDGIEFEADFDEKMMEYHLPPLSLQLLVENAVKHNMATLNKPLKIKVVVRDSKITVINNLNPKKSTYSTNTGLSNLRKRYQLLTDKQIIIDKSDTEFKVELPLIKK